LRLGDEEELKAETENAIMMNIPGASKSSDPWDYLY